MPKSKKRRTYGTGSLWLRGQTWWIRWRDGSVQHHESTHSDDRKVAQRKLNARLNALGGRRRTVVDPQKFHPAYLAARRTKRSAAKISGVYAASVR